MTRYIIPAALVLLLLGATASAAEQDAQPIGDAVSTVDSDEIAKPEPTPKVDEAVKQPKVSIGSRGFKVRSADGRYMFDVGGRVQVDGTGNIGTVDLTSDTTSPYYYAGGAAPIDGAELRRARIETAARAGDFPFVGEVEFADDTVGIKDFWLGYDGVKGLRVMVGNQKQPYSLEVEESSNDISYMERGIDSFLITPFVDRAIGARADTWGSHHFIAVGVYGDSVSPDNNTDDGWGTAGRFIYSPIVNDETVLHLGFRVAYRRPGNDDEQEVRIKDETTHMSSLSIVDTGAIDSVRAVTLFGPEMAFAHRFFKLSAEYNYAHFQPEAGSTTTQSNFDLQSAYVSLSIPLNGQRWAKAYRMSAGEFKHLENVHDFNPKQGHWGEFELAGRWAFIDLNDGPITGGREHAFSTALNWQLNYNVRMMFDWTYILKTEGPASNNPTNSSTEGLNIIGARAQFAF